MISVVIVNWNSAITWRIASGRCSGMRRMRNHHRRQCLHRFQPAFRGRLKDGIAIHRNSRNAGFAAACNTGWRAGKGTRILFLNPDTECFPGRSSARGGAELRGYLGCGRTPGRPFRQAATSLQRAPVSKRRARRCRYVLPRKNRPHRLADEGRMWISPQLPAYGLQSGTGDAGRIRRRILSGMV